MEYSIYKDGKGWAFEVWSDDRGIIASGWEWTYDEAESSCKRYEVQA